MINANNAVVGRLILKPPWRIGMVALAMGETYKFLYVDLMGSCAIITHIERIFGVFRLRPYFIAKIWLPTGK